MKQTLTTLILVNLISFVALADEALRVPNAIKEEPSFTSKDIEKMIPARELTAGSSADVVGSKIMDQSMDALMNIETVKAMPVAQVVQKLDLEQGIKFGSKETVEHKIGLRVLALQRMARIEYSGLLNAQAVFSASDKSINFNVVEELSQKSKLLINMNSLDHSGTANIQWEWP